MRHCTGGASPREHDGAVPLSLRAQAEAGECVLAQAVKLTQDRWGPRVVAAYALGSLAHGGFSVHISDVDFGLVLSDPLEDGDAASIRGLSDAVKASGAPLADRLSVFWGSLGTLAGSATGGRFPPLDRLDLRQFGRLLVGRDIRPQLRSPTLRELVVSSAEFALRQLSTPEVTARLRDPFELANAGTKILTKHVLYPVRFLFTARTGQVGMNDEAVKHFATVQDGPAATLARKGLEWRFDPPRPGDHSVVEILREGLLPLYRIFLADYEQRLREYGESDLARAYHDWQERLA